jgi:poly [ADP-ribose] polymerase 2/3/4
LEGISFLCWTFFRLVNKTKQSFSFVKTENKNESKKMDFSKLKVADLKEECRKRGLAVTGTKPVLLDRLNDAEGITSGETEEETTSEDKKRKIDQVTSIVTSNPSKKAKKVKKDDRCSFSGDVYTEGVETYAVMLNQTNISQNNNKFYVIQLIQGSSGFCVFSKFFQR